jgi:hypothetical protein
VPRRLDFVRFRINGEELEVAFTIALELAERGAKAPDEAARSAAERIRAAGASRPMRLTGEEFAALAGVIDQWEAEALTVRRLRARLP